MKEGQHFLLQISVLQNHYKAVSFLRRCRLNAYIQSVLNIINKLNSLRSHRKHRQQCPSFSGDSIYSSRRSPCISLPPPSEFSVLSHEADSGCCESGDITHLLSSIDTEMGMLPISISQSSLSSPYNQKVRDIKQNEEENFTETLVWHFFIKYSVPMHLFTYNYFMAVIIMYL